MTPSVQGRDRKLWGVDRLQTHVVMSGFARSGTTLCQLMCQTCTSDLHSYPDENKGIEKAKFGSRAKPFLLTKRPNDIFVLDRIRQYYQSRTATVRFVLFSRDPRAVLTSFHASQPDEYFVSAEWWRAIHQFWQWNLQFDDVLSVRYEDLIEKTHATQNQLTDFIGWTVTRPFETFHEVVPDSFDTIALNGVRRIDQSNGQRWRHPRYRRPHPITVDQRAAGITTAADRDGLRAGYVLDRAVSGHQKLFNNQNPRASP